MSKINLDGNHVNDLISGDLVKILYTRNGLKRGQVYKIQTVYRSNTRVVGASIKDEYVSADCICHVKDFSKYAGSGHCDLRRNGNRTNRRRLFDEIRPTGLRRIPLEYDQDDVPVGTVQFNQDNTGRTILFSNGSTVARDPENLTQIDFENITDDAHRRLRQFFADPENVPMGQRADAEDDDIPTGN